MKILPIYHCNQCKKITEDIESLYFVEENTPRGFCSEECIEKYFTPLINYYESFELNLRENLNLNEEKILKHVGVPKYMEAVLARPKEIWRSTNALEENVYIYISEFVDDSKEKFYMIVLCSVYNYKPSFIFLASATSSEDYLNSFRLGEKITDVSAFLKNAEESIPDYMYDEELINDLEQLKSSILASLMGMRKETDISLEQYPLYDDYLQITLEDPDDIYLNKEYDDEISVYIKAFEKNGVSFYYFALCRILSTDEEQDVLIPVLTFPSIDPDIYKYFKQGEHITGTLLN